MKYPIPGGHAQHTEAALQAQPMQQSSTGSAVPQEQLLIELVVLQQMSDSIFSAVQHDGLSAMSLPPTDTTSTSRAVMLSRMNTSCGSSLQQARDPTVDSSIAALITVISSRRFLF